MEKIKLWDQRYEEIKEIVVQLFIDLDICTLPINGFIVASRLGFKLIPYSNISKEDIDYVREHAKDGVCIELKNGDCRIYYDEEQDKNRLNWTIFHEIAHLVLGHTEHCVLADTEADFFAKYAIAPPILIFELGLKSPKEIMEYFYISYEAACNSWKYYQTWKAIPNYTIYEKRLLNLFKPNLHKKGGDHDGE